MEAPTGSKRLCLRSSGGKVPENLPNDGNCLGHTNSAEINDNQTVFETPKIEAGICCIFDHFKYRSAESKNDIKRLGDILSGFQLTTTIYENPTSEFIKNVITAIKTKDCHSYSCIVIVILGNDGGQKRVYTHKEAYSINDDILFPILSNPTLENKPKIFFVEANKSHMKVFQDTSHVGVPSEIVKLFSTFERYTSEGTIFIPTLCKHLETYGHSKDILHIIEQIIKEIKKAKNKNKQLQVPSYQSSLTESFIFGECVRR